MAEMSVRVRRMFHQTDYERQHWLACMKHGLVLGPLGQAEAVRRGGKDEECPRCCTEVALSAPQREHHHVS